MMTADGSSNNSINNCSSSGMPLISDLSPWYILTGVLIAVSCLFGIPANITVIVKLSRHLHISTISQCLFFNLAVSDLLCLLCLPVGIVIFFNGPNLTHGVCQLIFYFFLFCITSSLNILVLIAIQRFLQVLHLKKRANLGQTWQRFLPFTAWMVGALLALPVVFSLTEVKTVDKCTDGYSCNNRRITPVLEIVYVLFIVFSHIVLLSFYVLLVRGVSQIQMPDRKPLRATKIFITIIAVSLVVCFIPLILRVVHVSVFFTADKVHPVSKILTFAESFYFFNHCLNPFLYFFASRRHRNKSNTTRKSALPSLNDNTYNGPSIINSFIF